jgi:molybdopterin-guanine dinucleotide biosynthesis protein A
MPQSYDVIILAGSSEHDAALIASASVPSKALLPIAGQPMIRRVAQALQESGRMRRLVVVGLEESQLPPLGLSVPLTCLPNHGSIIANLLAGIESLPPAPRVLFCSVDIPLLTAAAVRDLVSRDEECGADFCYAVVRREVMEARFPGSGRSFTKLVDGAFTGGDIHMINPDVVRRNAAFGQALVTQRKSPLGLARVIGLGILLRFLTRRLRLRDLEARVGVVLGCSCRAIPSPFAEVGMDVDKPHHLQVVLRALEAQPRAGAS